MQVIDHGDGTSTFQDVELAAAGKWTGYAGEVELNDQKFQGMIEASKNPAHPGAPIKFGHMDRRLMLAQDGEPAYGWVKNLKVNGAKLLGDITSVPNKLVPVIKNAFKNRSIEYHDVGPGTIVGGKTYPAVLHALALLGVKPPAVKGLEQLADLYALGEASADYQTAFTGENGVQLAELAEKLTALIHTPDTDLGHAGDGTPADSGGKKVAIDEKALREALGVGESDDLTEAVKALKEKTATGEKTPEQLAAEKTAADAKAAADKEAADAKAKADADAAAQQQAPAAGDTDAKIEFLTKQVAELTAVAAQGATAGEAIKKMNVDAELKAAAGKYAPAQYASLQEGLMNDATAPLVRKMLAAASAVFPTTELGHGGDGDGNTPSDAEFQKFVKDAMGFDLETPAAQAFGGK